MSALETFRFRSPEADLRIRIRTTLKDRIAALQANSGVAPSSASSRSPSPAPSAVSDSAGSSGKGIVAGTRLRDKIARFDRIGGAPVPRGSFGLGAPLSSGNNGPKDFYGNTTDRPQVQRSASLRVPRTFELDSDFHSNAAEKPFETMSPRSRSGSSYSTISTGTSSSTRPSYLSPHYTGDSSSYFSRSASVRSASPNPPSETSSSKASPLGSPRGGLTADAVANLPASPSLRPNDITSSIATDADVASERTNLTTVGSTVAGSGVGSVANTSYTNLTSPTSTVPSSGDVLGRGRTGTVTGEPGGVGSTPSTTPPSVASHLSTDSVPSNPGSNTNETPAAEARPATPSYMAQAAALFPPTKRQSVHLPAMPIFSDPASVSAERNTKAAPADDAVESASSRGTTSTSASPQPVAAHSSTPSSYRPKSSSGRKSAISNSSALDDSVSPRASTDTAFFTAENESLSSIATTDALRRGIADVTLRLNTTCGQNGSGSGSDQSNGNSNRNSSTGVPPTPIPETVLDAFPTPPPTARPSPAPAASTIVPAPIPGARSVRPANTTTTLQNSCSAPSASHPVAKPRKKKPMLIPGKWINSDDEDDEEEETQNKGWARIIVSSRAR
jgi:hypothetical protein